MYICDFPLPLADCLARQKSAPPFAIEIVYYCPLTISINRRTASIYRFLYIRGLQRPIAPYVVLDASEFLLIFIL